MKLSRWAKQNDICYQTAYRWFKAGKLPVEATQTASGTIMVQCPVDNAGPNPSTGLAIYSRVSSHEQKNDMNRQTERLRMFCSARGLVVDKEVHDIGSGLNGKRKNLLALLSDRSISTVVVEHRDRLARFGVEYIEATLRASGRQLIVIDQTEFKSDLVQDFVDVVTCLCARIYGKRSSRNKARMALEATK